MFTVHAAILNMKSRGLEDRNCLRSRFIINLCCEIGSYSSWISTFDVFLLTISGFNMGNNEKRTGNQYAGMQERHFCSFVAVLVEVYEIHM